MISFFHVKRKVSPVKRMLTFSCGNDNNCLTAVMGLSQGREPVVSALRENVGEDRDHPIVGTEEEYL